MTITVTTLILNEDKPDKPVRRAPKILKRLLKIKEAEEDRALESQLEDEREHVGSDDSEEGEDGNDSEEVFEDDEFGPEDDGGVLLDDDMEELGYAPL